MQDLIDTKKLRMFVTTVKEGSMRKASTKLFVTPSALSHGIKSLEESLGTPLLTRSGPRVEPTQAGREFFNEAVDILSRLDAAASRLTSGQNDRPQELHIGLTNAACNYILPGIVREFRESCAHVSLKLEVGDTDNLIKRLSDHKIDIVIAPIQRDYREIAQTVIGEDELVYITHPSHPWATAGRLVRTSLERQQLIIPAVNSSTYNLVDARYREMRLPLHPFIELNNEDAIKQLVALNMGTGIVPSWIAKQEIDNKRLVAFQPPRRPLYRRWTIAHRPTVPRDLSEFLFIGTSVAVSKNIIQRIPL